MNTPADVPTLTRRELSLLPEVQKDRFKVFEMAGMVKILDTPKEKS